MNYGKKLLALPLIALFLFSALLLPKYVTFAQNNNYDVTVSPVYFDLSVNPGGSVSDRVRIRNNTNTPINIDVEVKKLTGDEAGQVTIANDSTDEYLSWIQFEQSSYELSPLEYTEIPFTIEVPESAAYGYYYTINFTDADVSGRDQTGAAISGAAAVPVLLNVRKDGAIAEAKLVEFSSESYINEYLPVNFTVSIENTGNVHIRPVGNIFISGNGNDNITQIDVNEGQGNIIPNTIRTFTPAWLDGFIVRERVTIDGQDKMKITINWNKLTDFRFGKYTGNLVMVYDNGERDVAITDSISFWVIPWKVIVGGIAVIIIMLLVTRYLLRKYINKEVKKRSSK